MQTIPELSSSNGDAYLERWVRNLAARLVSQNGYKPGPLAVHMQPGVVFNWLALRHRNNSTSPGGAGQQTKERMVEGIQAAGAGTCCNSS